MLFHDGRAAAPRVQDVKVRASERVEVRRLRKREFVVTARLRRPMDSALRQRDRGVGCYRCRTGGRAVDGDV